MYACYLTLFGKKDASEIVCLMFYFTVNKNGINVLIINIILMVLIHSLSADLC